MSWEDIIKATREAFSPKDATHLAILYLEDELNNKYDEDFAGVGFRRHALYPIANAMEAGKSDEEIRNMLNEEIPDELKKDGKFTKELEKHGLDFKDINFKEAIKASLDPEIEYLSHLRDK
tara:strand:+ start:282 stop:644 length:363 start_codon:yes stop_codon:yes gene_type:complete